MMMSLLGTSVVVDNIDSSRLTHHRRWSIDLKNGHAVRFGWYTDRNWSAEDGSVKLMTHPAVAFLTMNVTAYWCLFIPENHILYLSSVDVS